MAKRRMTIFTHHPQCELDCAFAMASILEKDFIVKIITIAELTPATLDQTDVLAFGGGIGDADDFDDIFKPWHYKLVRAWVANGGKYLGICMGAYWAGKHYFDLLGDINVVQYIKTPDSDINTEFETIAKVTYSNETVNMYFYDGCAFDIYSLKETDEVWATYANNYPMAIQHYNVGAIGCHPEAKKWWHEAIGGYNKNAKQFLREFAYSL